MSNKKNVAKLVAAVLVVVFIVGFLVSSSRSYKGCQINNDYMNSMANKGQIYQVDTSCGIFAYYPVFQHLEHGKYYDFTTYGYRVANSVPIIVSSHQL